MLIEPLEKTLAEQSYLYSLVPSFKPLDPVLDRAMELIDKALLAYEPLQLQNETSRSLLHEAFKELEQIEENLRKAAFYLVWIYMFCLLTAMEKNKGNWSEAGEICDQAIKEAKKFARLEPDVIAIDLLASLYMFRGLIWQAQFEVRKAMDLYDLSIEQYEKALHLDQGEFEPRLIHALQRVHKRYGDMVLNESVYHIAIDHYRKVAGLAKKKPALSFYQILLEKMPGMKRYFEKINQIDLEKTDVDTLREIQFVAPIARWLGLLSLDFPDFDEIMELFSYHYAIISAWQSDPLARAQITEKGFDLLMGLLEHFVQSDLYQEIIAQSGQEDFIEEPQFLVKDLLDRYEKDKEAISKGKNAVSGAFNHLVSPKEQELYNQVNHYKDFAFNFEMEGDERGQIEALEKALLYIVALINQGLSPHTVEDYQVIYYELLKELGRCYYELDEIQKALEYSEKAYKYSTHLLLDEFDYEPRSLGRELNFLAFLCFLQDELDKSRFYKARASEYFQMQKDIEEEEACYRELYFDQSHNDFSDSRAKTMEEFLERLEKKEEKKDKEDKNKDL